MKKLIQLLIIILSQLTTLSAQNMFVRTAGISSGFSWNTPVIQTLDNNYAFALFDFNSGNRNTMLVKMNLTGDTIFTKTFLLPQTLLNSNCLIQTKDSGFVIGGRDAFAIFKTDKDGNELWFYNYAGYTFGNSVEVLNDVIETFDGGLLLVGGSQDFASGANNYDVYIVKTDSAGTIQWTKTYGVAFWDDVISSVCQTTDSGYIMGGIGNSESMLMRTDSIGDTLWTHSYSVISNVNSVCQTPDGGFVASGDRGFVGGCIFKTDTAGQVQWAKMGPFYSSALVQLPDSNVALAGIMNTNGNDGDIYLFKFRNDGFLFWSKVIGDTAANGFYIQGNLNTTVDNGFIIGSAYGHNNTINHEVMIIKADSSGNTCLDKGLSPLVSDTILQIYNSPIPMTSNNSLRFSYNYSLGTPLNTSIDCSIITGTNNRKFVFRNN